MAMLHICTDGWEMPMNGRIVSHFWKDNDSFKTEREIIHKDIRMTVQHMCYIDIDCFTEEDDKVISCLYSESNNLGSDMVGCVRLLTKEYKGYKICGLGKMAVAHEYRKNGIADRLLQVASMYMYLNNFDVSILWASILKLYDHFGYVDIYKNMMLKVLNPVSETKEFWHEGVKTFGTW